MRKQNIMLYPPELATNFISEFEQGPKGGPALESYKCPAGVHPDEHITRAEAYDLLDKDLAHTQEELAALVHVPVTENQFIALMSFVFNFGITKCRRYTLFRMVNAEDEDGIREWWPKYCNPGTAYENGLRRRRYAELELFFRK